MQRNFPVLEIDVYERSNKNQELTSMQKFDTTEAALVYFYNKFEDRVELMLDTPEIFHWSHAPLFAS